MSNKISDCKDCDKATFCFTNPADWVFRTKDEMVEIVEEIKRCPIHQKLLKDKIVEAVPPVEALCK